MVPLPSFDMDLVSGLFDGCSMIPFLLVGLTQYFLKMASESHCDRERRSDAPRIALSAIDWYSLGGRFGACFCFVAGRGFEFVTFVGMMSSTGGVDASRGVGVRAKLVLLVYLRFGFASDAGVVGLTAGVAFFAVD